jgi:RNA polymerase sigma-70 factor (ECF subfamily)
VVEVREGNEAALVAALRAGDEAAFTALVRRYHALMLRVARSFFRDREVAGEVVQETWLAVLEGLDRFEERSSLKTWIFGILANKARTRGFRERRSVPLSALSSDEESGPTVDPDRFLPADHPSWPGHWASFPTSPRAVPHDRLESAELRERIALAVEELPERQRIVVSLRDIEGWSSEEVRNVLELSETNQRVLLHRGRAGVRRALEGYLDEMTA